MLSVQQPSFANMLIKKTTTDSLRSRNVSGFTALDRCYVNGVKILLTDLV